MSEGIPKFQLGQYVTGKKSTWGRAYPIIGIEANTEYGIRYLLEASSGLSAWYNEDLLIAAPYAGEQKTVTQEEAGASAPMHAIFRRELPGREMSEDDDRLLALLSEIESRNYVPYQIDYWKRASYGDPAGVTVYARKKIGRQYNAKEFWEILWGGEAYRLDEWNSVYHDEPGIITPRRFYEALDRLNQKPWPPRESLERGSKMTDLGICEYPFHGVGESSMMDPMGVEPPCQSPATHTSHELPLAAKFSALRLCSNHFEWLKRQHERQENF